MSNYAKLYWLTRLDYLQGIFLALAVIFGLVLIIYLVAYAFILAEYEGDAAALAKKWKWARNLGIIFLCIGTVFASLIPTRSELVFIIAGGKTIDFVQKDSSINKIPNQATKIVSDMLENEIKKLKDEEKSK